MYNLDKDRKSQYNIMFFTLKIVALFFCVTPFFQYFFKDNENEASTINIATGLISLAIISIVTFMWYIMDYRKRKNRIIVIAEMVLFYAVSLTSIIFSGGYKSYYKFIFIFIVVSYAIERGMLSGIITAVVSSSTLLAMDLIMYPEKGQVNPFFQTDIALSATFLITAWILGTYVKIEDEHISRLTDFASLDGLTETYNHRYFQERLNYFCETSKSEEMNLSLIFIDLDYFKVFNDLYGHQKGDDVLRQVAKLLKENSREKDIVCRYGGEEFTIILPNTSNDSAVTIGEKLRKIVEGYKFDGEELMPNGTITISVGVAEFNRKEETKADFIGRADSALYRAKFFRRNRVELYASVFDQFSHLDGSTNISSVKSLITVINSRDSYTYSHIERVVLYCQTYSEITGMENKDKVNLIYGAYLHDLGKINVSKNTLIASAKLSNEEWEEMKRHPIDSADIIRGIVGLEAVVDIVLHHHEKYDGTGYPDGLSGKKIPSLARILAVADCFDAMTSSRPYQRIKTYDEAFQELRRCKGTQFDPEIVEIFINAINTRIS